MYILSEFTASVHSFPCSNPPLQSSSCLAVTLYGGTKRSHNIMYFSSLFTTNMTLHMPVCLFLGLQMLSRNNLHDHKINIDRLLYTRWIIDIRPTAPVSRPPAVPASPPPPPLKYYCSSLVTVSLRDDWFVLFRIIFCLLLFLRMQRSGFSFVSCSN